MSDLRLVIESVLNDVHIETGRKDEHKAVVDTLEKLVIGWQASRAQQESVPEGWKLVPVDDNRREFFAKLSAFVDDYVDGYELRGDGDYTPNEKEQLLIEDCVAGLLHELDAEGFLSVRPPSAQGDAETVADQWLIQMRGDYLVTRGVWERPDHLGYTNDINEAGRYSEDEAKEAERMMPQKCKAVHLPQPAQKKSVPVWQVDAINHALDVLSKHGDAFTSVGAMSVLEEMIGPQPPQEGSGDE